MKCHSCGKNEATVHITDIAEGACEGAGAASDGNGVGEASSGEGDVAAENVAAEGELAGQGNGAGDSNGASQSPEEEAIQEHHLCPVCAQNLDVPYAPPPKKTMADIWKMLQHSVKQTRSRPNLTCNTCGMSLDEFRRRGRLGCPLDYELFRPHIEELIERVHGSKAHVGRVPGISEDELVRVQQRTDLQHKLDLAVREEAYESAARIRDQLKQLEEPLGD